MSAEDHEPMNELGQAIRAVADAVSPINAAPGKDATGGIISSLTEAVMGMTAGLVRIAESLDRVADAIRERGENGG